MGKREDLRADTPPLETLKILHSLATTECIGYQAGTDNEGMEMEFSGVNRAFSQMPAKRATFVELPPEGHGERMCGTLP
eukprot:4174457-Lingulodinium_polyedra.AAC.1